MKKIVAILLICQLFIVPGAALALDDQGLSSLMSIIDKAVETFSGKNDGEQQGTEEEIQKKAESASATIVNLSRTLGKLSYSRLQCGQADVLAEFTQRVQKMPEEYRNLMRDAFQVGFDQSKSETELLSEDECKRLTQSRNLGDKKINANVEQVEQESTNKKAQIKPKPEIVEDPKLKHMRIAELSGQLAYKRKFCGDNKIVTRDFNEVIRVMPEEYQSDAKKAYWKGYKHGKRMNSSLTPDKCH